MEGLVGGRDFADVGTGAVENDMTKPSPLGVARVRSPDVPSRNLVRQGSFSLNPAGPPVGRVLPQIHWSISPTSYPCRRATSETKGSDKAGRMQSAFRLHRPDPGGDVAMTGRGGIGPGPAEILGRARNSVIRAERGCGEDGPG